MSAPILSRVDPSLPAVDLHDLACPGCGQTLAFIKGTESSFLPDLHYRQPVLRNHSGREIVHVGVSVTGGWRSRPELVEEMCEWDNRYLNAVVVRAQRDAVGLVNP